MSGDQPYVMLVGERVPVLVNAPCVPVGDADDPGGRPGAADGLAVGREIARIGADRNCGVYVDDACVWIGDGLALAALVEQTLPVFGQAAFDRMRVYVPLDSGDVVAVSVIGGETIDDRLVTDDLMYQALDAADMRENRARAVLLLRHDSAAPARLASVQSATLPDDFDIAHYVTQPSWSELPRHRLFSQWHLRVAGAGAGAALAFAAAVVLTFSWLGPPPDAAPPGSGDPDWLDIAGEPPSSDAEAGPAVAAGPSAPDPGPDPSADAPPSSARWDLFAWTELAESEAWAEIGVSDLRWLRAEYGRVVVAAAGEPSVVWPKFAAAWGAEISLARDAGRRYGAHWSEPAFTDLPPDATLLVRIAPGQSDIRHGDGDGRGFDGVCRRNGGTPGRNADGTLGCEFAVLAASRWQRASADIGRGRLESASCRYDPPRRSPVSCRMAFRPQASRTGGQP